MITKMFLEEQRALYIGDRQKAIDTVNALDGAIQAIEALLGFLAANESPAPIEQTAVEPADEGEPR